jgi:2-polyprenyl-3-methyl-5-hydroxy-6-metoxy-1,4-benzoquinol methylase
MAGASLSAPRYWINVAASPTHQAQLRRIPPGSRVLEIGAAGGHMTQALIARGCEVVAVEAEAELARRLREVCAQVIEADIEGGSLGRLLAGERFDVILLGDVLEHLRRPERALLEFRPLLRPEGYLVVSLPNVAHASVRLALLQGAFDYRPEGLLDATHLRFFTRASLLGMFARAGWTVRDLGSIERGPFDTEIPLEPATVPVPVLRALADDPDARVYQYVFRAVPSVAGIDGPPAPMLPSAIAGPGPGGPGARAVDGRRALAEQYKRLGQMQLGSPRRDPARARRLFWRAWRISPAAPLAAWVVLSVLPPMLVRAIDGAVSRVWSRRSG